MREVVSFGRTHRDKRPSKEEGSRIGCQGSKREWQVGRGVEEWERKVVSLSLRSRKMD